MSRTHGLGLALVALLHATSIACSSGSVEQQHAAPPAPAAAPPPNGQLSELPLNNRFSFKPDGRGGQLIVLPFGTVQTSSVWKKRDIPVCWEHSGAISQHLRDVARNSVASTWQK